MRFARAWLPLLLTALIMAFGGAALGAPHYFCRMAGRVVADCCCKTQLVNPCEKGVSPEDCCVRVHAAPALDPSRTLQAAENVPPAALAATLAEPLYLAPHSRSTSAVTPLERGPPPLERLFVIHCAFLI